MPPSTTAAIAITANASQLPSALRTAAGYVQKFASGVATVLQKINLAPAKLAAKSWAPHAIGEFVGKAASRGLDMLIDQGKQIFDFNDQLVRFGIAARKSGVELDGIGLAARRASNETGMGATEVLRGARAYVDIAGAAAFSMEKMSLLARVSQASQSDIGDMAQVMFQMQRALKIPDNELENALGGVINMSKDGAVHFAQMAKEINEIAPQAARFGMVGRKGFNEMAAMMQVMRTGFATVDEMGTGITRIFAGLTMHADKFEKYGVKIFDVSKDGTKTWRHFSDILKDIQKNDLLSKDPFLLRKAFGRSEAERGIRLLFEQVGIMHDLEEAGERNGVVQQDLATYTESAGGRMKIAFEKMKNAIAEAFTPERIDAFVNAIEGLADKVGPLAELVGKLADGVGGLYGVGKAMRRMFTPGDSRLRSTGMEEAQRYAREHAMSVPEAYAALQKDWSETLKLKKEVDELMPNDRTTKESDKRAVRAYLESTSGSDLRNAAMSYIYESGMTPKRQREIEAEVRKDQVNEAVREGRAYSEGPRPGMPGMTPEQLGAAMGQAMQIQEVIRNQAASDAANAAQERAEAQRVAAQQFNDFRQAMIDQLAPAIGRSVAQAIYPMPPPQLNLDGNKVSTSTNNATDQRRR